MALNNAPTQLVPSLTFAPDPVAALATWTATQWPALRTDPAGWQPEQTQVAVLWRLARITEVERRNWGSRMELELRGHVLHPLPQTRLEWVRRVTEALALERRLSLSDDRLLYFQRIAAESDADGRLSPLTQGQIMLVARTSVRIVEPPAEPLEVLVGTGDLDFQVGEET